MRNGSRQSPVFSRGNPVLDYWLAHAEGFRVEQPGSRAGRVDAVLAGSRDGRAAALVVRSGLTRRRRTIPAETVAGVAPAAEVLLLEPRRARPPARDRMRPALAGAAGGWSRVRASAPRHLRGAEARLGAAAAWSRPRLASAGRLAARYAAAAAAHARRGLAWLRPRAASAARTALLTAAALAALAAETALALSAHLRRELARAAASARQR